jgi:Transcriptional regulator, AbiEi antitoxin N-terminal domain/Transcriptional regulator, AbiEi antitoxin, Type IV TA system
MQLPAGIPISSEDLALLGISADLAVYYARAGWLVRLSRGVFLRTGEALKLYPSLRLLERRNTGLHVGGKTALDSYGVRHYVSQPEILHLYGWVAASLPEWFTQHFPSEYLRKRLFKERPDKLLHVSCFENRNDAPLVSAPERALLEVLSDVGVRQPLHGEMNSPCPGQAN